MVASMYEDVRQFHAFLLWHTETGCFDRQEVVSMLPVLWLQLEPQNFVLDMCASPGSKTSQIVDFLSTKHESEELDGMVVANDIDRKRGYMLVRRLLRNSLGNAVVSCCSGDQFPGLYDSTGTLRSTNTFDRVLCDVPCSGDGTLRKKLRLWMDWHIGQGLTLHSTQIALAMRGAALLKVGGIMVYSTCSFNPVENEAVVSEVLRRSDGALELVDLSDDPILHKLRYRRGRRSWKVGWRSKSKSCHKGKIFNSAVGNESSSLFHQWFSSYNEVPEDLRGNRIVESMFPARFLPHDPSKTLRMVPIDNDSGGFFIAVLRKVHDLPTWDPQHLQAGLRPYEVTEALPPDGYICKLCSIAGHYLKNCPNISMEAGFTENKSPESRITEKSCSKESQYRRISTSIWDELCAFYGIDATNHELKEALWSRSDGASSINYVCSKMAVACLGGDKLNVVNMGLKVFTRTKTKDKRYYRPTEEGLSRMVPFMKNRIFDVSKVEFMHILNAKKCVRAEKLSDSAQTLQSFHNGPVIVRLQAMEAGQNSFVFNVHILDQAILPRISTTFQSELQMLLSID
uniref:tRNA (Cytosine5)methyltransferase putative n=1 Tax=Albugo laibachii Nc14 TaxID=890382 RepID=F0WLC4_9STRA|nr:tRNA (cytosine5)methyltransferase putative [Albugo laibachii Nc14]|eukprot:CCA22087.1 tRNA (cytosine5)methyltransferase putative [Albugo laibachii Nc14]